MLFVMEGFKLHFNPPSFFHDNFPGYFTLKHMHHEIQTLNYIQQFDVISEIYHFYHSFIIPLDIYLFFSVIYVLVYMIFFLLITNLNVTFS